MAKMNAERWQLIDELFHSAIDLPAGKRREFLERACATDPTLGAEIEKLLAGYERAGNFIETPPALDDPTLALPEPQPEAFPGRRLGAYEVIREIGRGGM